MPNLTVDQFKKVVNIVVLESKIAEQNLLSKRLMGDSRVIIGKRNYSCYNQLNNLIKADSPEQVFKNIVLFS